MVDEPSQKVTWCTLPDPVTPPDTNFDEHFQTDNVVSHDRTSSLEHPLIRERPEDVSSNPELDDVFGDVPDVGKFSDIDTSPAVPPPKRPFPTDIDEMSPISVVR